MKAIFAEMDEDGGGTIDEREFRKAMRHYKISVDEDDIKAVYLVYDPDKNGLDYDEFMTLLYGDATKKQ